MIMTSEEFIKVVMEVEEIHKDHNEFYELAEKYGFLTPWSEEVNDSYLIYSPVV